MTSISPRGAQPGPWFLAAALAGAMSVLTTTAFAQTATATKAPPKAASARAEVPDAGTPIPEAAIRKALAERLPQQLAKIDEISRTPIPGLYEVRYAGTELLYTDAKGDHVVVGGAIIDTRTRTDLTEARMDKLLAVDFGKLPLRDAIAIKQGSGVRKVAVFVDPNCGYCKRFERDLSEIKDLTVYTFLLPILGPDSTAKSRDIWCAKDNPKAWRAWMLEGVAPPAAGEKCDATALDRNLQFGRAHKINGTPAVLFEDGTRKPGALPPEALERLLATATAARKR